MRDLKTNLLRIRRGKRRSALSLLLLLSTSPLAHADDATGVRNNPFCAPELAANRGGINLASGGVQSTIRLKPIGKAIGLKSLSAPESKSDLPRNVGHTEMTIESVPSVIHDNPLIESVQSNQQNLVDVDVVASDRPGTIDTPDRIVPSNRSTITLTPNQSSTDRSDGETIQTKSLGAHLASDARSESANAQPSESTAWGAKPRAVVEPSAPELAELTEAGNPVFFSLSDRPDSHRSELRNVPNPQKASNAIANQPRPATDSVAPPIAPRVPGDRTTTQARPAAKPIAMVIPEVRQPAASVEMSTTPDPVVISKDDSEPIRPKFENVGGAIRENKITLVAPTRQTKRYRPPVEVKPIPVDIARLSDDSSPPVQVEMVPELDLRNESIAGPSGTPPIKLKIDLAQVRSLTVGNRLHKVQVADSTVCKVVASGSHQLKLIGTGQGMTQLVIFAEANDASQPPLQRTFQIEVSEAPEVSGQSLAETSQTLTRSIQEAFPGCNVMVVDRNNQLTVAGRCDSQASAKKILRMVRKTCLVPVRDELIVHQ